MSDSHDVTIFRAEAEVSDLKKTNAEYVERILHLESGRHSALQFVDDAQRIASMGYRIDQLLRDVESLSGQLRDEWIPVTDDLSRKEELMFWCPLDGGFPLFGRYAGTDDEIEDRVEYLAIDRNDWYWPVTHYQPRPISPYPPAP